MDPELVDVIENEDEVIFLLRFQDGRVEQKIVKREDIIISDEICAYCGEQIRTAALNVE